MNDLNLTTSSPHSTSFGASFSQRVAGGLQALVGPSPNPPRYQGPERRNSLSQATRWLSAMLDEIDYGMLLLIDGSQVLHVNHAARAELDAGHPLQLLGRELRARHPQDVTRLHDALAGAQRGLRKLVTLGDGGEQSLCIAVVPLGALGSVPLPGGHPGSGEAGQATLLVMGKRQVCEGLTVQCFARIHSLTPAETRVLEALCRGLQANEIAAANGVGLATVRTQIGAIRQKTGASGIRDLLKRVSVLPPILGRLRMAA